MIRCSHGGTRRMPGGPAVASGGTGAAARAAREQREWEALPTMRRDGLIECCRCRSHYMTYHMADRVWTCRQCRTRQRQVTEGEEKGGSHE
jgi:hypothetical protein